MRKQIEPANLTDFDGWGSYLHALIRDASRREKSANSLPPLRTKYGALRAGAYSYLSKLTKAGLIGKLQEHVTASGAFERGPAVTPAAWVLRLIALQPGAKLHPAKRSRVAKELDFALLHNIDPELVLGFLYEVGMQMDILEDARKKRVPEAVRRYATR